MTSMFDARELKAAIVAVIATGVILGVTFAGAALYHQDSKQQREAASSPKSSPELVAQGRAIFFISCAHCHGDDADGGEDGPSLHKLTISPSHIRTLVTYGIKDEMPSFSKKYNDSDIAKIAAYLKTLK
jgi:mono/diheme cytochrome c family protein